MDKKNYRKMYEHQLHRNQILAQKQLNYEKQIDGMIEQVQRSIHASVSEVRWKQHTEETNLFIELLAATKAVLRIENKKYGLYDLAHQEEKTKRQELARTVLALFDHFDFDVE